MLQANDETIAVGMVDGLVSVARRETEVKATKHERRRITFKFTPEVKANTTDLYVKDEWHEQMSQHDKLLRKFQFTKAFVSVLKPYIVNKHPHVTVAVLQRLMTMQGLKNAVAGNDTKTTISLLKFLIKYLGDYRFARVLIDVSNEFLGNFCKRILE